MAAKREVWVIESRARRKGAKWTPQTTAYKRSFAGALVKRMEHLVRWEWRAVRYVPEAEPLPPRPGVK